MSCYYYYVDGVRSGPVTGSDLVQLAANDLIKPETIIEQKETGKKLKAEQIQRLVFKEESKEPIKPQKKNSDIAQGCMILLVLIVAIVWLAYSCCSYLDNKPNHVEKVSPTATSAVPTDNFDDQRDINGAWIMSQDFVKAELKSPSTAKFPFGGAVKYVTPLGDNEYRINSYVDSQNTFGGTVRTKFKIAIKNTSGTRWEVTEPLSMWE